MTDLDRQTFSTFTQFRPTNPEGRISPRRSVGLEPVERAEDVLELDPSELLRPRCLQEGEYAGQAYSLDRMR
jgi:hypothetical protein